QQVIWNLLRNAVKFTPRSGRITIRSSDGPDSRLQIQISDTGIGIAAPMLDRIFEAFEQGGLENDHRFGGLGLGLSIVREIVLLHGGTIAARSDGIGHGATFELELPSATGAGGEPSANLALPIPPMNPTAPDGGTFKGLRLLVVEDHEATLQILTKLLTRAGHQVVGATDVASALAAAADRRFDAVISDLGLPDGNGFELMNELRARYQLRGIAVSGYGMEADLRRSREAGFAAHLTKPVDFPQLQAALAQL
ncbi:MAG TPA: ATP-binding protein, partial [Chthoniobacteraceae bacterium]